jgi:hypothetical protein
VLGAQREKKACKVWLWAMVPFFLKMLTAPLTATT